MPCVSLTNRERLMELIKELLKEQEIKRRDGQIFFSKNKILVKKLIY